jgi:hypothetical protein
MPTATTAPRQDSKKARRQARTLLRRAEAITPELIATVRDLREAAVHAEPRHSFTHDHLRRCQATEPFAADEA